MPHITINPGKTKDVGGLRLTNPMTVPIRILVNLVIQDEFAEKDVAQKRKPGRIRTGGKPPTG